MHLRRLAIHALPGIEPGFTFEPPHAGINVVVGPNAIGKSSLARALGYLLASRASDPPALSLEAELASGDARWQVSRNGNQIVWRRSGEIVPPPALPGADRIGLFRLSVEHLLDDDDANDKALAERLWRELHGNFDLSQPRIEITPRFARHEAVGLSRAGNERRRVEREYADLQRREADLPDLEQRIETAVAAGARRDHLRQALGLADAIDARKAREAALQPFPPDMDRLRGDEIARLEEQERKTRELRETLRDRRRDLEAATADLERTGLAQSIPAPEDVRATEERLRWLGEKLIERGNVQVARTEAGAAVRDALRQLGDRAVERDDTPTGSAGTSATTVREGSGQLGGEPIEGRNVHTASAGTGAVARERAGWSDDRLIERDSSHAASAGLGAAARDGLEQPGDKPIERDSSHIASAEAGAAVGDALAHVNGNGNPPRLDAGALRRAEEVAVPLTTAQVHRRELKVQLDLAGEAPEAAEVERQRYGVEALRAWLAGNAADSGQPRASGKPARIVSWVALAFAAFTAVAAWVQDALAALAGALASLLSLIVLIVLGLAPFLQRARQPASPPPTEAARRRFDETGLAPPPQWNEQAVRKHLGEVIEARLNVLTLQQTRAAGSEEIAHRMRETDAEIDGLEEQRAALAGEVGFDPRLPVADLQRFIHLCTEWDKARVRHAEHGARLDLLDQEIADAASLVRDFLGRWRPADSAAPVDSATPVDSAVPVDSVAPVDSAVPTNSAAPADSAVPANAPTPADAAGRPDLISLRSAFDDLKRRNDAATDARHRIETCETAIRSTEQRIAEVDKAVERLFTEAGIEPGDRTALVGRTELLPEWKEAREALRTASTEETLARDRLAERPDLVALADEDERARLEAELAASTGAADEYTPLVEERTKIETRLNDAGRDRKLEHAAAEEGRARQALEDKRDEALLAAATRTLLDDVEQAFVAEHEPAVLRRARAVFAEVTARAFDLRLRGDGTFIAHDVRQGAERALSELSSGTRMQLLLALRMAWIETREQGGETLPLFLDEALTTSDEARFAVMAQSLERLAGDGGGDADRSGDGTGDGDGAEGEAGVAGRSGGGAEDGVGSGVSHGDGATFGDAGRSGDEAGTEDRTDGGAEDKAGAGAGDRAGSGTEDRTESGAKSMRRRQIFYLSARRHEPALWEQATGARPAVVDLTAVRFPSQVFAPEDYRVETPPALPAPNGRSAEEYASLLGVPPRLDPHRPEGGIHLFHLLRDDPTLLHVLMDTWRVSSLGQLEVLLASDAAQAALPGEDLHRRLRQRCRVVRTWVELWRRGRGRPVDRGVLEQCPAVSATFIDRVADLAARVRGDGEALVQALRAGEMDRFRSRKIDELEQWLADEGCTDDQERLTGEDRRRLTLQRAAPETVADADDVNRVVSWLEASGASGEQ